jgi:predicted nucleic acid-binding protein
MPLARRWPDAAAISPGRGACDSSGFVVLIDLMGSSAGSVQVRPWRGSDEAAGVAVFVACELEAGAARVGHADRERARLRTVLQTLAVSYPDERFAPVYGDLLDRVLSSGRSIATMDLLIGTSAVVDAADLVTANRKHFDPIPGLRVLSYR